MPTGKVYLKKGDRVRWVGPSAMGYIGWTAVVKSIVNNDPKTLIVEDTSAMNRHGLGGNWGSVPDQWEVVVKVNPRNEWGEEGL